MAAMLLSLEAARDCRDVKSIIAVLGDGGWGRLDGLWSELSKQIILASMETNRWMESKHDWRATPRLSKAKGHQRWGMNNSWIWGFGNSLTGSVYPTYRMIGWPRP